MPLHPRPVSPTGWHVEVERTDGSVFRPNIVGDPEWIPRINDLPKVRIPVERSERWTESQYEKQPMRVWKEGNLLCIDQMENVIVKGDRVLLEARGGLELLRNAQRNYVSEEAHVAAENLVQAKTSYATDFDSPDAGSGEEVQMQDADSTQEFNNELLNAPGSKDAWEVENGSVIPLQRCWTVEAENGKDPAGAHGGTTGSEYSGGNAILLSASGDYAEFDFTTEYDIEKFDVAIRQNLSNPPTVRLSIDGASYGTYSFDTQSLGWNEMFADGLLTDSDGNNPDPIALASGDHTLTLEAIDDSSGDAIIDVLAPFDRAFSPNFDNTTDSDNALSGPGWYPGFSKIQFQSVGAPRAVVAGEFTGGGSNPFSSVVNDQ